jgi:tyrosyl-tRNA synthetase
LKVKLEKKLVSMYHSEDAAGSALAEFERMFKQGGLPDEIPIHRVSQSSIWIVKLLTESGLAETSSEARRLIEQGGVYLNENRIQDVEYTVKLDEEFILKVGKRRFVKVSPVRE